jgi:hypothetical protein
MPERTFFQREAFTNDKGQRCTRFTTGALGDTGYVVAGDGSVRHGTAQFKGSKKNRKRFKIAVTKAMNAPVPDGFVEIESNVEIVAEDRLYDVVAGDWVHTPFFKCTLIDLNTRYGVFVRACHPAPPTTPAP